MNRRGFSLGLVMTLLGVTPLRAETVAEQIVRELKAQGYGRITVTNTLLGRARILAVKRGAQREIVVNPRTGEILRDLFISGGNAGGTRIIDDDDDDNSGRGRGRGGNSGSGGNGGSGGGSGSGGGNGGGSSGGNDDNDDDDDDDSGGRGRGRGGSDDDKDDDDDNSGSGSNSGSDNSGKDDDD